MASARTGQMCRWTAAGVLAIGGFVGVPSAQQQSTGSPSSDTALHGLVNTYCLSCHNNTVKSGDLDLRAISDARVSDHRDVWEKVVRKLRARQIDRKSVV